MKLCVLIVVSISGAVFFACDNPAGSDSTYNWEGHGSECNEAYRDSILFVSTRGEVGTPYAALHYMYKDGSGIHFMKHFSITNNGASWSPRKWKVLFRMWGDPNGDDAGLYVMDYDGSDMKRLTPTNEYVFMPASWSPDGQWIAYLDIDTLTLAGTMKIMHPDGSGRRTVTTCNYDSRLSWLPDSKKIVYDLYQTAVYSIDVDGSGKTMIFSFPDGCVDPVCSPDGDFIAFSGHDNAVNSNKIFTYNIGTAEFKELTHGSTLEYYCSWSPDSRYIVFDSRDCDECQSSIYIMNSDGTNIKRLTDDLGYDYNPCWYNN